MAGFEGFDEAHEELEELFLRHQDALVSKGREEALRRLEFFETRLRLHLRLEEEHLLPALERGAADGAAVTFTAEFYLLEHKKMLDLLAGVSAALVGLPAGRVAPRAVVEILDREWMFKNLMDHHVRREHSTLFPELLGMLDRDTTDSMLAHCRREWKA